MNGARFTPFHEGRFTVNTKLTANEQGSERWKTKNAWHRFTLIPLTPTYSQCFVPSSASYRHLQGPTNAEWQSLLCHLCVDHMPRCALYFSNSVLKDSQDTRPFSLETLQDSGSWQCYRSCRVILDQHQQAASTPQSERTCKKFLSRQLAGVHRQLTFMSFMMVEDP